MMETTLSPRKDCPKGIGFTMKSKEKRFIVLSLMPALLCFACLFLYPVLRTFTMSVFAVPTIGDSFEKWSFVGTSNYISLLNSKLFLRSMENMLLIWVVGGIITMFFSLLYATIIGSGVKGKSFWRSIVYLPNIISAVALANMWTQYVFNVNHGLFTTLLKWLGLPPVQWTSPENIFWSMLVSFCFGCVGYYMLIFLAGIDRIPADLYESAYLDGAGKIVSFFRITFPLLRGVFRTCLTLWSVTVANFFVWTLMFSQTSSANVMVPAVYMYTSVLGANAGSGLNVGAGSAVGVVLTVIVVIAYVVLNVALPERGVEY